MRLDFQNKTGDVNLMFWFPQAAIPFNEMVLQVLQEQRGKHPTRVFACEGQRIKQVITAAWYKAIDRAGIEDFR